MLPFINPKKEVRHIVSFLQNTFRSQHIRNAVIGVSGGIDSTVSLYLIARALGPGCIYPVHLPYFTTNTGEIRSLIGNLHIPLKNLQIMSVRKPVEQIGKTLKLQTRSLKPENPTSRFHRQESDVKIRLGNIMARVRMIILFDRAKKRNAMVCGTENRTEHLLGYFTRFGDQASDVEPISHLYKTQVYQLAEYLDLPESIIRKEPSANLWRGQTDEGEFGFTYEEADQVLYSYYEKKLPLEKIIQEGFKNTQVIVEFMFKNRYKLLAPYYP